MQENKSLSSPEAAKEPSARPVLATPLKSLANLAVPDLIGFARRSSPRAEEVAKTGKRRKLDTTRKRLVVYQSVDDAVQLLKKSQNIVVLSGAGISTSVGIPDFRSDKGLYQKLSQDLGIEEPEDFFSNSYFQEKPAEFFSYVKAVLPRAVAYPDGTYKAVDGHKTSAVNTAAQVPKYSLTHAFLALLQSKEKLLTNYSQNIDGLELAAGLHPSKFIQCHGTWDTAACLTCGKVVAARKYLPIVFQGNVPFCKCSAAVPGGPASKVRAKKSSVKPGKKRKRAVSDDWGSDHSSDAYDNIAVPRGLLKPNITFFEDPITADYRDRLQYDKTKVDLLIVIGTSLKVAPIQQMLYQIPPHVPQIYISKTRFSGSLCSLPGVQVDIELLGEADAIIEELCRRAGWTTTLRQCLWEKGQTKIKAHPSMSSVTKQAHANDYGVPTKKPKVEISVTSKEIKSLRPEGAKAETGQPSTPKPEEEVPRQAVSRDTITAISCAQEADGAVRQPTQTQIKVELSPSARITTTLPTIPDSNVKIELVEGTMHQWRFTRNA